MVGAGFAPCPCLRLGFIVVSGMYPPIRGIIQQRPRRRLGQWSQSGAGNGPWRLLPEGQSQGQELGQARVADLLLGELDVVLEPEDAEGEGVGIVEKTP